METPEEALALVKSMSEERNIRAFFYALKRKFIVNEFKEVTHKKLKEAVDAKKKGIAAPENNIDWFKKIRELGADRVFELYKMRLTEKDRYTTLMVAAKV